MSCRRTHEKGRYTVRGGHYSQQAKTPHKKSMFVFKPSMKVNDFSAAMKEGNYISVIYYQGS